MISLTLAKPVKINIKTPTGLEPDFETIGKVIDNIIILANKQKTDLTEVGKEFSCDFVIGKKNKYVAKFGVGKTQYNLTIEYLKELTKFEASRPFAVPPKEKAMAKEAERLAKEQIKEKEKKEKATKTIAKKKKDVKKDEFSDLD